MATGTGKTYTAFQIVYRLLQTGAKQKILYLADRNNLIDQTIGSDYDIQELDYKNVERLDYRKYKTQLKPVISKDDKFDIEKAKEIVIAYVKDLQIR